MPREPRPEEDAEGWDFEIVPGRKLWRIDGEGRPSVAMGSRAIALSDEKGAPAWVDSLESAALTLAHSSADIISAMSVTCGLSGGQRDMERLVLAVGRLADQFCLDARVRIHESALTVRFTRAEAPAD